MPKTIQIFLPSGDPRGIRIAEITTRIVQVIEVPRSLLQEFIKMPESGQVALYVLIGDEGNGTRGRTVRRVDGRRPGSGEAREPPVAGLPGAVVPFGRGRGRATETGAPAGTATREAPRRRSELAGERPHKRPCGGARRLGAADGGRSMTATRADVERAVSGRPGRGPRNGRVWDGDCPRAVTPLVQGLRSRRRDSRAWGGQPVSLPPRRTVGPAQGAHLAPSQLRHEEGPGDSHVEAATLSGDPI